MIEEVGKVLYLVNSEVSLNDGVGGIFQQGWAFVGPYHSPFTFSSLAKRVESVKRWELK